MKNTLIITLALLCYFAQNIMLANTITGSVNKNETLNRIIDNETGEAVRHAKISIPKLNFTTYTNDDGTFQLNTNFNKPMILSVEKEGYRPFSITIDNTLLRNPLKLGIEKNKIGDLLLTNEIYHLGDNIYSNASANCSEFRLKSIGPSYSKNFSLAPIDVDKKAYVVLGSVIGLDTKLAKQMKQNSIDVAYSSPMEVYFNSQKIAELSLNGDNIEIPIPNQLVKTNNTLTIKTGHNLFQRNYTDYDDVEIMNISIEIRNEDRTSLK